MKIINDEYRMKKKETMCNKQPYFLHCQLIQNHRMPINSACVRTRFAVSVTACVRHKPIDLAVANTIYYYGFIIEATTKNYILYNYLVTPETEHSDDDGNDKPIPSRLIINTANLL